MPAVIKFDRITIDNPLEPAKFINMIRHTTLSYDRKRSQQTTCEEQTMKKYRRYFVVYN